MKLKIMTFNIQHGRNNNLPGDVMDLNLMAQVIKDQNPHILSINEIRQGINTDNPAYPNQPEFFKNTLGGDCYFGNSLQFSETCFYGNAVWSVYPFVNKQKVMIPDVPKEERTEGYYETRCILRTDYTIEGKPLTVLSAHFGLGKGESENAVQTVLDIAKSVNNPIILMGDFNVTPANPNIKRLAEYFIDVHAALGREEYTFTSNDPYERIDYIFAKGLTPISANTVKVIASDHFPITAELEF